MFSCTRLLPISLNFLSGFKNVLNNIVALRHRIPFWNVAMRWILICLLTLKLTLEYLWRDVKLPWGNPQLKEEGRGKNKKRKKRKEKSSSPDTQFLPKPKTLYTDKIFGNLVGCLKSNVRFSPSQLLPVLFVFCLVGFVLVLFFSFSSTVLPLYISVMKSTLKIVLFLSFIFSKVKINASYNTILL